MLWTGLRTRCEVVKYRGHEHTGVLGQREKYHTRQSTTFWRASQYSDVRYGFRKIIRRAIEPVHQSTTGVLKMPIDEAMDVRHDEDLIQGDMGESWALAFKRMENFLTLMTRERVVVETMLTIGIGTVNPEAI